MGRTAKLDAAQEVQLAELLAKGHSYRSAAEWFKQQGVSISRDAVATFVKKQRRGAAAVVSPDPGATPSDVVVSLERRRKQLAKLAAEALKRESPTQYLAFVTEERKHAELLLRASGAKTPDAKADHSADAAAVMRKIDKLAASLKPSEPVH